MVENKVEHAALVGLKAFSNDGIKICKQVIKTISNHFQVSKVSSVYKVQRQQKHPLHNHDLRRIIEFEGLSLAFQILTEKSSVEVCRLIGEIEKKHCSEVLHKSVQLTLIVYENETYMTKKLTLPNPTFHDQPEILFPAAEIWGEYRHPVLQQTLHTLTRKFANQRWGEFFEQGKTVLDF